ncbi:calaxin-like [Anabrus simplex]|uniref:calaxin-like n=1 Tax=Anabrus simplex TaxID=316456 RepID=UPI0035A31EFF
MVSRPSNSDSLLDPLEEIRFKHKTFPLSVALSQSSHFNLIETETLLLMYYKLTQGGTMDRKRFRAVLHAALDMTSDTLMDRIFTVVDRSRRGNITMESWIGALSLFLRGTQEEKIKYAFSVYDVHHDGMITKDIMFVLMNKSLIRQSQDEDADEGIRDLVEMMLKRMDLDRDGRISFNDFRNSCLASPLLLEALGDCLPSKKAVQAFLTTFDPKTGVLRTCTGKE